MEETASVSYSSGIAIVQEALVKVSLKVPKGTYLDKTKVTASASGKWWVGGAACACDKLVRSCTSSTCSCGHHCLLGGVFKFLCCLT
jgi:hypothetical protein